MDATEPVITATNEEESNQEKSDREEKANQEALRSQWGQISTCYTDLNRLEAQWEWKRWRLARFIESDQVKGLFAFLVCANAIIIGVSADSDPESSYWFYLEIFFVSAFAIETGSKIWVFEGLFWTDNWNVMDFIIVSISLVDLFLGIFLSTDSSGVSAFY